MHRPLISLGALAAGFGVTQLSIAQEMTQSDGTAKPQSQVVVEAQKQGKDSVRATTTEIGKGKQALRDIPQSITVVTEKLIDDRNLETLKDALRNTAGISFQAAEGGEEDIRLRGFSLQTTGDIFVDGLRDPAFYDRDSFNWDRLEVLRGSASMLFGRGSTGGAVNQVSKQPMLMTEHEVAVTMGSGEYLRGTADLNFRTGENAALRLNAMQTLGNQAGLRTDKVGFAPTYRFGIGTADEFSVGAYYLKNDNGIHYGLPWINPSPSTGGSARLWPTDPKNYYGLASDYNQTEAAYGTLSHIHRFGSGAELKTVFRGGRYERDLRSGAIRFAAAALQPGGVAVNADTFGPNTVLTRGGQNKIQDSKSETLQSDYSGKHQIFGLQHAVAAGVDLARDRFNAYAAGAITKPTTTVGTPNDGASVDESSRAVNPSRSFEAKSVGVYVHDLAQIAPAWKLLAGLRWDRFEGTYNTLVNSGGNPATNPCAVAAGTTLERSDSQWSRRFGVLYQPTEHQSYHLSYGTSFNTSGDAYQYDAGTVQTDPESSRNIELGAKLDSADGRFTTRLALFHATKYNERNRDTDTVNACNYVLSGKRHAQGFEIDVAGKLTPAWEVYASYAYIPRALIDEASGATGAETAGTRPGLTPRHSGTVWTTYQVTSQFRVGGGITARSKDVPVGLAAGSNIVAPSFVTADAMAEYAFDAVTFKLNVINLANKHYADVLYRGHYVPGKPRTVQLTATAHF